MKSLGLVLVVLGLIGLVHGGLSWTRRETGIDAGPIAIAADRQESVPIPPVSGTVMLVAGLALQVRKRA